MKCKRGGEILADYLAEPSDPLAWAKLDDHLAGCSACRAESGDLIELWNKLPALQDLQPSREMDTRFHIMLAGFREGMEPSKPGFSAAFHRVLGDWLGLLWPRGRAAQFSFALLLFSFGVVIGIFSTGVGGRHNAETATIRDASIVQLREEVASLKQLVTLSLLQQQSASERLRGVESSQELERPGQEVLAALLRALESDANVNVRLAAVDALQQFARNGQVRTGLLECLPRQSSPLVQIELINLMVKLKETSSVPALRALIESSATNETVRERARWGLEQLG